MSWQRTLDDHLFGPGPKRILSLDGGGVRGLVTLGLLQRVEDILKARSGQGEEFRLCDYFDLIGGRSTGGIIATLLALGFTVAEVQALYLKLCPDVFQQTSTWRTLSGLWGFRLPKFDPSAFKRNVDSVIEAYVSRVGMPGQEPTLGSAHLKTGLGVVMKRIDTGSVWVLTNNSRMKWWDPASPHWKHTIDDPKQRFFPNKDYALRTLALATASAPFYLDAVEIGISPGRVGLFLDGGASPFNNPAIELFLMTTLKQFDEHGQLDPQRPFSPFGFDWETGEDKLFLYSVGTGTFRTEIDRTVYKNQFNLMKAKDALRAVIDDGMKSSLIWLQALSEPNEPFRVDENLCEMRGLRVMREKLLTFKRINPLLNHDWLKREIGIEFTDRVLARTREFDNADRANLTRLDKIGKAAGEKLVGENDFPPRFDPAPFGGRAPPAA